MHEVLVNRLGGLSLPRKSVVRLTDRPDMTLDVNRGRKTTIKQQQHLCNKIPECLQKIKMGKNENDLVTGQILNSKLLLRGNIISTLEHNRFNPEVIHSPFC